MSQPSALSLAQALHVRGDREIPAPIRLKLRRLFAAEAAAFQRRRNVHDQIISRNHELAGIRREIADVEREIESSRTRSFAGERDRLEERIKTLGHDLRYLREREAEVQAELASFVETQRAVEAETVALSRFLEMMMPQIPGAAELKQNWQRTGDGDLAARGQNRAV